MQDLCEILSPEQVIQYQRTGFVRIAGLLSPSEAALFRERALEVTEKPEHLLRSDEVFVQAVNNWRTDSLLKSLTFNPRIHALAKALTGVPLRLWHDQILVKAPHSRTATEFHQDQPYWPHQDSGHTLTAWIALNDIPQEQGCLAFIPRSHLWPDLPMQDLTDSKSLAQVYPQMEWIERVTVPLRAGDCTFHHGRCAHMAHPNLTETARVAYTIIFMDRDTRYSGAPHIVTDPLGLEPGSLFEAELFPLLT